ncbi:hypothetical protein PHLGIDRAFT_468237 [Phlebiopsis gigantea 11061_1 CR5-6]|uniref:Uncharacterized protein n=1 Tax=Phlebiopsis gigantea (strain 11061_1 CR5-6) TaxID=745531 RepID=A0A0C3RWX4_PHLG1|nr:hypothetical protein PHLGIDRAFT_468237 [Phlebiopsis gigantea 11061_1 CR5-6]
MEHLEPTYFTSADTGATSRSFGTNPRACSEGLLPEEEHENAPHAIKLRYLGFSEEEQGLLVYLNLSGQALLPRLGSYIVLGLRQNNFASPSQTPFVSFQLRNGGEFPLITDLIGCKKVNESILENGDVAASGLQGVRWDICISIQNIGEHRQQRKADTLGSLAHKVAGIFKYWWDEHVTRVSDQCNPYGLGKVIMFEDMYLVGLAPVEGSKCMYLGVLAHKKSTAASTYTPAADIRSRTMARFLSAKVASHLPDSSRRDIQVRPILAPSLPGAGEGPYRFSPIHPSHGAGGLPSTQPFRGVDPSCYTQVLPSLAASLGLAGYQSQTQGHPQALSDSEDSWSAYMPICTEYGSSRYPSQVRPEYAPLSFAEAGEILAFFSSLGEGPSNPHHRIMMIRSAKMNAASLEDSVYQ